MTKDCHKSIEGFDCANTNTKRSMEESKYFLMDLTAFLFILMLYIISFVDFTLIILDPIFKYMHQQFHPLIGLNFKYWSLL
jgi:hypothetical protein